MDSQIKSLQEQKAFRKANKPKSYEEILKEKGLKKHSTRGFFGGLRKD